MSEQLVQGVKTPDEMVTRGGVYWCDNGVFLIHTGVLTSSGAVMVPVSLDLAASKVIDVQLVLDMPIRAVTVTTVLDLLCSVNTVEMRKVCQLSEEQMAILEAAIEAHNEQIDMAFALETDELVEGMSLYDMPELPVGLLPRKEYSVSRREEVYEVVRKLSNPA